MLPKAAGVGSNLLQVAEDGFQDVDTCTFVPVATREVFDSLEQGSQTCSPGANCGLLFQFGFRSKPFVGRLTFHTSQCMLNGVQIRALGCPVMNLDLFNTQILIDWLSVYPFTSFKYNFVEPSPIMFFSKPDRVEKWTGGICSKKTERGGCGRGDCSALHLSISRPFAPNV